MILHFTIYKLNIMMLLKFWPRPQIFPNTCKERFCDTNWSDSRKILTADICKQNLRGASLHIYSMELTLVKFYSKFFVNLCFFFSIYVFINSKKDICIIFSECGYTLIYHCLLEKRLSQVHCTNAHWLHR